MIDLPLVSEEIEQPEPIGWIYTSWQAGRQVTELTLNRFHPDQLAHYRQHGHVIEDQLFGFGALDSYAASAVQAEQDIAAPLIDKCAKIVTPHLKDEDECAKLAKAVIEELTVLRRLVARGRNTGDRISEQEPLYWWTESEVSTWRFAKTGKSY